MISIAQAFKDANIWPQIGYFIDCYNEKGEVVAGGAIRHIGWAFETVSFDKAHDKQLRTDSYSFASIKITAGDFVVTMTNTITRFNAGANP